MFKSAAGTLLLILGAAFLAPLIAARFRALRLPALVFEIVFGIVIGPDVLDLVRLMPSIQLLSDIGLATLIFLAGFELDLARVRGRPLRLAMKGWGASVVLGLVISGLLLAIGVIQAEMFVAFAMSTTALGTLLPIIRDEGMLETPFGVHVLAIGSVGEFLPIVAVALLLSRTDDSKAALALMGFGVASVGAVLIALHSRPGRIRRELGRTLRSSGQLYIRLALVLIAGMTFMASELGLDFLLGAFVAGIVYRLYVSAGAPEAELEVMESKIEAVSFGYVVPIFFVVTGIRFDLHALAQPTAMLKVPLFVAALLVVRGLPVLFYRHDVPGRSARLALALFSATGLPLIVAICQIGVDERQMRSSTAAALVGAGMISVLIFPVFANLLLRRANALVPPTAPSTPADPML
ncbi:MAG: cation:proton antiporter [Acidimicrobiia bacterium]